MDSDSREYKRKAGLGNLFHCFEMLAARPGYDPVAAQECLTNCFNWLRGTDLDPCMQGQGVGRALAEIGKTETDLRLFLMRGRGLRAGDQVKAPFSPDHIITADDVRALEEMLAEQAERKGILDRIQAAQAADALEKIRARAAATTPSSSPAGPR